MGALRLKSYSGLLGPTESKTGGWVTFLPCKLCPSSSSLPSPFSSFLQPPYPLSTTSPRTFTLVPALPSSISLVPPLSSFSLPPPPFSSLLCLPPGGTKAVGGAAPPACRPMIPA